MPRPFITSVGLTAPCAYAEPMVLGSTAVRRWLRASATTSGRSASWPAARPAHPETRRTHQGNSAVRFCIGSLHPYRLVALLRAQMRNKNASNCCKCLSNKDERFFRKSGSAIFSLRFCARKCATKASQVGPARSGPRGTGCAGGIARVIRCSPAIALSRPQNPRTGNLRALRSLSPFPRKLALPRPPARMNDQLHCDRATCASASPTRQRQARQVWLVRERWQQRRGWPSPNCWRGCPGHPRCSCRHS